MKDATSQLRKYYIDQLQGNISVNGVNVPVYDDEVNDTVAPFTRNEPPVNYILIKNQNSNDISPKCGFQEEHAITTDSYATFPAYNGGFSTAELINEQIKALILTDTSGKFALTDFNVYRSRQTLSTNLSEKTKEQNIYRRITIFTHSIQEI